MIDLLFLVGFDEILTPTQLDALQARYPGQVIEAEREQNHWRIWVNGEVVAKSVLLADAFEEAMT